MTQVDTEKFRLRHFVEKLVQEGECVVHDAPIDLIDVAAVLDCNPNAVWFRAVGPEKTELVGNVMGTRRRLAAALDADEAGFPAALRERLRHPVAPIEVPSSDAPVHDVVLTGDDADLTSAAGPPAARARRRALYFRQHRLCARPAVERHQYRLPPPDAARTARRRRRPQCPERPAGALSGRGRQGRAHAGRIRRGQPSNRFSRGRRLDPADGRARSDRRRARRSRCRW